VLHRALREWNYACDVIASGNTVHVEVFLVLSDFDQQMLFDG
jgi:hypothetical protein